jgi:hypothetical protein
MFALNRSGNQYAKCIANVKSDRKRRMMLNFVMIEFIERT